MTWIRHLSTFLSEGEYVSWMSISYWCIHSCIQFATQKSYLLHDGYYSCSIVGVGSVGLATRNFRKVSFSIPHCSGWGLWWGLSEFRGEGQTLRGEGPASSNLGQRQLCDVTADSQRQLDNRHQLTVDSIVVCLLLTWPGWGLGTRLQACITQNCQFLN